METTTQIPEPLPIRLNQPQEADLKALATVEKPKKPSRKEIGQMRRQHMTYVKPTVTACEHSFDQGNPPNNHCEYCWAAYFLTVAPLEEMHTVLRTAGIKVFKGKYGDRVTKQFGRFLNGQINKESEDHALSEEGERTQSTETCDSGAGVCCGQNEESVCVGGDAGQEVEHDGVTTEVGQESGCSCTEHQDEPAHI